MVCAGAYGSPAILLRSGIGPAAHLRDLGIDVHADLPVGDGLRDHPQTLFELSTPPAVAEMAGPGLAVVARGAGWWAFPVALDERDGVCAVAMALTSQEPQGTVRLASTDPTEAPVIVHNSQQVIDRGAFDEAYEAFRALVGTRTFSGQGIGGRDADRNPAEVLGERLATARHPGVLVRDRARRRRAPAGPRRRGPARRRRQRLPDQHHQQHEPDVLHGRRARRAAHRRSRHEERLMDLATARTLVDAAIAHAETLGVRVVVTVVDPGGHVVAKARMDDAVLLCVGLADDKAYTAVSLEMPSAGLAELIQPGGYLHGLNTAQAGRVVPFGGGVPGPRRRGRVDRRDRRERRQHRAGRRDRRGGCRGAAVTVGGRARSPRTVIVTGAATGIGRATAQAFGRLGCWVLIADRNVTGAHETLGLVRDAGGDGRVRELDVTDLADLRAAVDEVIAQRERIDVLVNNAGRPMAIRIQDITEEQFDVVLDVNLKATFFACKYVIEHMLQAGGGAIVNTASDMGLVAGLPNQPAYVASKGAVVLLTKALAVDYAEQDIRVNCVCPCLTDTPMIDDFLLTQFPDDAQRAEVRAQLHAIQPIARMNTPEEVASAIVFLGTPASSGTTGVALPVDGGFVAR